MWLIDIVTATIPVQSSGLVLFLSTLFLHAVGMRRAKYLGKGINDGFRLTQKPAVMIELLHPGRNLIRKTNEIVTSNKGSELGTMVEFQKIMNNHVLTKLLTPADMSHRYVINIVDGIDSPCSSSRKEVLHYLGEVYSQAWNLAVAQRCLNLDVTVISDRLQDSSKPLPSIFTSMSKIHTFQPSQWQGKLAVEIDDTSKHSAALTEGYKVNSNLIHFIDAFSYSDTERSSCELAVYKNVAIGGTFDHLHYGHRSLLSTAAALCTGKLTIGITSNTMLTSKQYHDVLEGYTERKQAVEEFLNLYKPGLTLNCTELQDPFGPAISDDSLQAIVVSSETIAGAFAINKLRVTRQMPPLEIVVITRKDAVILSSTFLREHEMITLEQDKVGGTLNK